MIPFWVGLAVGVAVAVAAAWYARRRSRQRIARLLAAIASGGATSSGGADDLERSITKAVKQLEASKQSELESAHRELRLREQSLSGIAEGVVLLSDSRVVYANTAAEQILGNALSGGMLRHTVLSSLAEAVKLDGAQDVAFDDPINQRSLGASARTIDESGNTVVVVRDETEARRLAAVRRDFVADASHELKTPVAAIHAAI